jgi:hypothetical protein
MNPPRGKLLALSTVAVGLAVLIAVGFAAKDRIREEWYLSLLKDASPTERLRFVSTLGEVGSARAFAALTDQLVTACPEVISKPRRPVRAFTGEELDPNLSLGSVCQTIGTAASTLRPSSRWASHTFHRPSV